jgi:hypothetical protein
MKIILDHEEFIWLQTVKRRQPVSRYIMPTQVGNALVEAGLVEKDPWIGLCIVSGLGEKVLKEHSPWLDKTDEVTISFSVIKY